MCMTRRGAKEEGMRGKKGGGKQRTFFAKGWRNDAIIISTAIIIYASRVLGKICLHHHQHRHQHNSHRSGSSVQSADPQLAQIACLEPGLCHVL